MQNRLLFGSAILCASPGLALLLLGQSSLAQVLGVIIILFAALMIPYGFFTKGGVAKFAWLNLSLTLFVLIFARGYIPLAGGFSLGFSGDLVTLTGFCVLLVEMGIVLSMLYGNYKGYVTELKKAGYDEEEFRAELRSFDKFLMVLVLASTGISVAIYFLFSIFPSVGIDALTGLVIAGVIYFIIARYILAQRRIASNQPVTGTQS